MDQDKTLRQMSKEWFEEKMTAMAETAKHAGFDVNFTITDPMEEAVADEPCLVQGREVLEAVFKQHLDMANSLGYNIEIASVSRDPKAPAMRDVVQILTIWPKYERDEKGYYIV